MKIELKKSKALQSSAKAEPLKGKRRECHRLVTLGINEETTSVFYERDLKSAIEWLKGEIKKDITFGFSSDRTNCAKLIDKAFEDVK